jgi:hypothetical protein
MSRLWKVVLVIAVAGDLAVAYVALKALEYRAHINEFLDKYNHVVAEFSQRDVYAAANASLRTDRMVPNRVVFLGAQLFAQWDAARAFPHLEAVNRSVAGQRFSGMLLRFFPDVVDLRPAAVVIEVASYNFRPQNTVEELEDYLVSMMTLAHAAGIRPVPLTVIPTCSALKYDGYQVADSLRQFNLWLRGYCAAHGETFVDAYQLVADDRGLLPDSLAADEVALRPAGYSRLVPALNEALQQSAGVGQVAP